jgi:hypothetical protein
VYHAEQNRVEQAAQDQRHVNAEAHPARCVVN